MTKFLFTILITCSVLPVQAQQDYALADSLAMRAKGDDVVRVHQQLTGNLPSDELKVRAFYSFITHRIRYDIHEAQKSDKVRVKQEPSQVLRSGKAICHGYSALFLEFCRLSGIPCQLVSGYTKPAGIFDREGHTWNVVKIDGKWLPVDATWGAGGVNNQGKYVREFTNAYFLTGSEKFLEDHYPFDPMWQLVNHPVGLGEYKKAQWNFNTGPDTYFNFNDTISAWEKADSTTRIYLAAQRMVRFNPGDPVVKEELAYATFMMGNREFQKANRIIEQLFPGRNGNDEQNHIWDMETRLGMLDSADGFYQAAMSFYDKVQLRSFSDQTVLQNNIKALRHNRDALKRSREAIRARQ